MAKQNQNGSFGFILAIIAAILTAGTGAAWWAFHSLNSSPSSSPTRPPNFETVIPSPIPEKPNVVQPLIQKPENNIIQSQVNIYWVTANKEKLEFLSNTVSVQKSANKNQVLQTALEQLLSQTPTQPAMSLIPTGTQLLSLKINSQGVYLNLSANFTEGGGSDSMAGRLGQIIYTASSLNPNTPIWISVEGQPLETLGGEGLIIEQPITRQWFKENFES